MPGERSPPRLRRLDRRATGRGRLRARGRPTARRHPSNRSRTSASQNSIRSGRRGLSGAMPFGAQVDPAEDDAERNPLLRPLPHQLETRPDDPDQVPGVHPGQMVFDLAAIITDVDTRPGHRLMLDHPRLNRSQMTSPAMSRRVWPLIVDDQPAIVVDVPNGAAPPGVVIGPVGDRATQAGTREPPPRVTDPPAVARPQPSGGVGDRGEDLDQEPSAIDGTAELGFERRRAVGDRRAGRPKAGRSGRCRPPPRQRSRRCRPPRRARPPACATAGRPRGRWAT